MTPRRAGLSETELEVLKALWEHGPATVRELNEELSRRGRRWAYTTMLTLLARLEAKGYAQSDKRSVAHVFRATMDRQRLLRDRLTDLADELCGGTTSPLMQALVESARLSSDDLARLRQLLDEQQPPGEAKPPSKPRRKR